MKPWKPKTHVRFRYSDPVEIFWELEIGDGIRLLVIGDGSMGAYEWAIERAEYIEEHSDAAYGIVDIALRDGLIEVYGLPPAGRRFLIWSNEHQAYWRPNRAGYTERASDAGLYPQNEAIEICEAASHGSKGTPNETMLPPSAVPKLSLLPSLGAVFSGKKP